MAGNNLHVENLPAVAAQRTTGTRGILTGTSVRVLDDPGNVSTGKMLTAITFYDDRQRVLQTKAENYKGGIDLVTNQYNFSGQIISSCQAHTNPALPEMDTLFLINHMDYDYGNRLTAVWNKIADSPSVLIARHTYNESGQLVKKELGSQPGTALPIETLDYSYNIRGWMNGINKAYVNSSNASDSRWFGMELNYDEGFDKLQLNGNISGIKWRSKGDGEKRAYGFTYDATNRLIGADFSEYSGTAYGDNSLINYDMQMGDGVHAASAYDENGNIRAMKQWGLKLTNSPVIDDLAYHYYSNSNKLLNVMDAVNDTATRLGDFRTSGLHVQNKLPGIVDYKYDNNGNLINDFNKDLGSDTTEGITYNHLNLPARITVQKRNGIKGTIQYVYDATGNKLEKIVDEKDSAGNAQIRKTTYLGALVYENDRLKFIQHGEGHSRVKDSVVYMANCVQ